MEWADKAGRGFGMFELMANSVLWGNLGSFWLAGQAEGNNNEGLMEYLRGYNLGRCRGLFSLSMMLRVV